MQETEKKDNSERYEIDWMGLFRSVIAKWWLILIVAAAVGLGAFLYTTIAVTPMYDATTSVLVINQAGVDQKVTYADTQLGLQIMRDYNVIAKSRTVLGGAIASLGLEEDLTISTLKSRTTITNTEDTRCVSITVSDPNPERAADLANAIREQSKSLTEENFGQGSLSTIDEALPATSPSSPHLFRVTIIAAFIGAFLVIAVLVILFLSDNSIKDVDDVERYLGLSTLASIPIFEDEVTSAQKFKRQRAEVKKV